jgi:chromosome segregation protein
VLKLKKIELVGFKSFCERTEMQFNGGGIAGIVGPNGCGKSNLSDAISWVLGEQSAKLLRGTRMEDVIFNGTRERKPMGMASVTMTLIDPEVLFYSGPENGTRANGGRAHGSDRPGEITVTRRLFRSGESEYLLNGKICRLRDIQEIFMGTGLGPESYAIIEQGRIGQILSSRPYDRRAVVEEAAGITKFKTKKKLAEAKLESARQNLSRVNDILEEVSRQVNSLKRQAAKARRYEELRREMIAKLTVVLGSRHSDLERQAVRAALDMNLAAEELRSRSAQLEQMEAEHEAVQKESFDTEQRLQKSREALASAAMEGDRARQKMEYQARLAEENGGRMQQAEAEMAALEGRLEELGRELERERANAERLAAESGQAREKMAAKAAEADTLQSAIREQEGEQEKLRQRVLSLLGEASSLKNQLAQIEEFLAGLERHAARVRGEEASAEQEMAGLTNERKDLIARLERQQLELESLESRRQAMETSLAGNRQQAQAGRERVESLKAEISRMQARRDSLEEILSHRAYTTETVKKLFAAIAQGRLGSFRAQGILADFMDVDARYEKAVEEFLREELEYVVVPDWEQAEEGMRVLRAEVEGHATFLVHPEADRAEEQAPLGPETGIVGRLRDHVRLTNGFSSSIATLLPRLGRCYIAEDERAARRLAYQYPELYFLLPDGLCYHGYSLSGGRKTSSGPLALKRELRELAPRLAAGARDLEAETGALAGIEKRIAEETEQLERLRAEMQRQEKSSLASQHELRQIHDRLNRAGSRLSVARLEMERIREDAERASQERQQYRAAVEQRESARAAAEAELAAARQAIAASQGKAAQAIEEHARLRAQAAALEERRKAALASTARAEQTLSAEKRRCDEMRQQIAAWAAERERLLNDNGRLACEITGLERRRAELEAVSRDLETALQQRRARMAEIEEALKAAKVELESARERRSSFEIRLVRLQSDLQHLAETCLHELGKPIAELAPEAAPLSPEAMARAEQEYSQLQEKIEALGPVNVLALEEYQEAQQRHDFLDAQRQDLIASIRDTQQAISEIDSVSRKQFLEAFERINENFRRTFATLFGGGTGEMRLTDETNIAESGIDIVASPPGKRLQNVLLLSGGEKALTAIALLMAVFQYQPSPFCILDEVDAPLDEANVIRFTRLIRQMSGQTQFILITHNRTTMEVAQTLYGVTMEEPGVSRLVSVKFGENGTAPRRPPAAPPAAPASGARV